MESSPVATSQLQQLSPPAGVLVMLVGAPGSGKSYLARRIVDRLGADIVQTDALRKQMFREPRYTGKEHAAVYAEAHRRLERLLKAGHTVVFDATNLAERPRRSVYRIVERHGASLVVVHCYAPVALVRQRLAGRLLGVDPLDRSDATWAIHQRLGRLQPIRQPHLQVNTSVDLRQAVELIASRAAQRSNEVRAPQSL
jgi:predicted kinase